MNAIAPGRPNVVRTVLCAGKAWRGHKASEPHRGFPLRGSYARCGPLFSASVPAGFSLIEVVIALTILAVLSAAAIPSMRGVQRERQARVPIQELVRIAKDARLHAMKEQRPYQVVLTSTGFTATRYFDPYLSFADLSEFLTVIDQAGDEDPVQEADPTSAGANVQADNVTGPVAFDSPGNLPPTAKAPLKKEWTERYDLPPGTTYSVKFWHETDATDIQGEIVKLWVFQPSGICEPMKIHLARDQATFDIEFSALTVDIVHEASAIQ